MYALGEVGRGGLGLDEMRTALSLSLVEADYLSSPLSDLRPLLQQRIPQIRTSLPGPYPQRPYVKSENNTVGTFCKKNITITHYLSPFGTYN